MSHNGPSITATIALSLQARNSARREAPSFQDCHIKCAASGCHVKYAFATVLQ